MVNSMIIYKVYHLIGAARLELARALRPAAFKADVSTDSTTLPSKSPRIGDWIILEKLPECQFHFFL